MKFVADERFGKIGHPESFADLLSFVLGDGASPYDVWMWRGQSDAAWLLDSGIYRKLFLRGRPINENVVRHHERYLLDAASHRGYRHLEGRLLSDFELLARLQHHGAATRLLDTTRNLLVAIFFACRSQPDRDGMLFGIHANQLGGGEGRPLHGNYDDIVADLERYEYPQTWEPPNVSTRISAQHSQFVFSAVSRCGSHGSIAIQDKERYLLAIQIPSAHKEPYLVNLRRCFDISELSMFPDLEGFARRQGASIRPYADERW